ncbi:hypothetical protein GYMLUDRAFT_152890 [Collybiopsis luxurians FD-317 M1]|nr:hypothetical protein GYMLUDRAFT_152890 [Collybiopsis luxurians FD-317 M1]
MLCTHLTNIQDAASRYPSKIAFKIPHIVSGQDKAAKVDYWIDITFAQFLQDIEQFARYWFHILNRLDGIPQRSIVAIWSVNEGYKYLDVLHVYGISRAGYTPQLINSFPNASYTVIQGPLKEGKARALVFESIFEDSVHDIPNPPPSHAGLASVDLAYSIASDSILYPLPEMVEFDAAVGDDIALILQTSGSASGAGSIVPCNHTWLDKLVHKSGLLNEPPDQDKQEFRPWTGSICHFGQFASLIGTIYSTCCVVQFMDGHPSTYELIDTIIRCGIKKIFQFPYGLTKHLQVSRTDSEVLATLSALDEITYSGGPLSTLDEEWAIRNGINLKNVFANTQCGILLTSQGLRKNSSNLLKPYNGALLKFEPLPFGEEVDSFTSSPLLELVVPPEAIECPHKSLRSEDGNYHTHDLFREVQPGEYIYCGRNDDWINMENCKLCNTKSIEDTVREQCSDIILECVVVGSGRPSPVLIVETNTVAEADFDSGKFDELAGEIFRRISPFHSEAAKYAHERITCQKMIIVVPPETLPRTITKGNVRRRAAEVMFEKEMDYLF